MLHASIYTSINIKLFKAPLKRKRPDEKPKCKDVRSSGTRVFKKHCALPVNNLLGDGLRYEVPKLSLPKNDNSDKFWASIEPYCANVNAEDINVSCSQICARTVSILGYFSF